MKIYIILKDGEPIEHGSINPELWDEYEDSMNSSYYYAAKELSFVTLDREIAEALLEECKETFEGKFSIGELHLVLGEKEWN